MRSPRVLAFPILALAASILASGLTSERQVVAAQTPGDAPVTFSEHIAPILFANCASCHRPGEAAPFPLLSYRDARPLGRAIGLVTTARTMPPWKAAPGDHAFANERRLTDDEITTIARWVDGGMPEGDPARLPARPAFTEGWQLGPPDLVVSMDEAFEVPATGPDVYRNFVLPLNLEQDTWVRAVDFRPSDRTVVHHSLFFLDATGAARARDARDPEPGFAGGMGGLRVGGASRGGSGVAALLGGRGRAAGSAQDDRTVGGLGGWAVGGRAIEMPGGLAFFVPKGADLVLSTHFHPSGQAARERSTVGLYFADAAPTRAFSNIQLPPLFGVFEGIDIPAGERDYTIRDSFVLPVDIEAFAVGAHAHYIGKRMHLTATLPDGAVQTLLRIDDWDFSWQERYRFREFVRLPKGTRLDVEIGYDNSAANKRNPTQPPVRVAWGEESNDEMGSVSLQVVAANEAELPQLEQAYVAHLRQAATTRPGLRQLIQRRMQEAAEGGRGRGRSERPQQ